MKSIFKLGVLTAVTSLWCASVWGQAAQTPAPAKNWKDRAEYDLFESARTQADPAKKVETLNAWKEKYPATEFKQERLLLYLNTYQQLNQVPKGIETAKEMLATDPKDLTALSWITYYTPLLNDTSPGTLQSGEQAANGVLENLDTAFAADKKPAAVDAGAWQKARTDSEAVAHKTLGWTSMTRKENEKAEEHLKKSLALNPGTGDVAYWLGQVIIAQRNPAKQATGLYYFARAATYDGPGALNADGRKQIDAYLTKAYATYHGGPDGLDQLKMQAKSNPMPPPDFKIESASDLAKKKLEEEEEFKKKDPQLALWKSLKAELTAENGQQYFDTAMKGAGVPKLRGKLVSQDPPVRPKQIVLALSDDTTPEVTLNLAAPLAGKADAGTVLQFEGVPSSYTKEPFMLIMDAEKEKIDGWPAQAAAPKKPAARKPKPAKRKG